MSSILLNVTITIGDVEMYVSNENKGKIIFKLGQLMKEKGLSKNKLSELSGTRFDTITYFIQGNITRIDLDVLCRLCSALDCKIEDLFEYEK